MAPRAFDFLYVYDVHYLIVMNFLVVNCCVQLSPTVFMQEKSNLVFSEGIERIFVHLFTRFG